MQAEDGIRDAQESRGLGDVYKRQSGSDVTVYADYHEMLAKEKPDICAIATESGYHPRIAIDCLEAGAHVICEKPCLLYTSDAADDLLCVYLCCRRIIKKKKYNFHLSLFFFTLYISLCSFYIVSQLLTLCDLPTRSFPFLYFTYNI